MHGVVTAIPGIEIAQNGDAQGMGSPEAEHHTLNSVKFGEMGAHPLPNVVVVAFGEEMAVHLTHPRVAERPGIVLLVNDATAADPHAAAA